MSNKTKRRKDLLKAEKRRLRRGGEGAHAVSLPKAHAPSPSLRRQAVEHVERFDQHAFLRNKLREVAGITGEWAGIPMPLQDEALIVEPRYPYAEGLMKLCAGKEDGDEPDFKVRNSWYSAQKRCDIYVVEHADGRIDWGVKGAFHALEYMLRTLGCSSAWGIEQESNAVQTLGGLVSHHQFKSYLLTGTLMEQSKRSGLFYMFRRLRPTVAIAPDPKTGGTRILAALCMHPIAYYRGSWAGAMCPTDDVIAHLQLMRGDERMFWKRSNQHPSWRPEAGL